LAMANCERCGKLFVFLSIKLCPECREHEDRCLRRAREILMREPNLSLLELAERLDEPLELVEKLLRERRLTLKRKDGANLTCEICGKAISEGRRCASCDLRMRRIAEEIAADGKRELRERMESRERMHSLTTIRKREGEGREEGGA